MSDKILKMYAIFMKRKTWNVVIILIPEHSLHLGKDKVSTLHWKEFSKPWEKINCGYLTSY